ncbi:MAG: FecR domain-containing protein, partial [Planctomycetota bacterium]
YLAGDADAAAVAQLNALLQSDPSYRARFTVLARMHGHLAEIGRHAAAGSVDSARLLAPGPSSSPPRPSARTNVTRRWAGWAAAASILIVTGIITLALGAMALRAQYLVPIIAQTEGSAFIVRDGMTIALKAGTSLRVGDRLHIEPDSHVKISLRGGTCELAANTEAVVEEVEGLRRSFSLVRGELISEVSPTDVPLAVQTKAASIAVQDAAVRIQVVAAGTAIAVSRGSVEVHPVGGEPRRLPAGQRLDVPIQQLGWIPLHHTLGPVFSSRIFRRTGGG